MSWRTLDALSSSESKRHQPSRPRPPGPDLVDTIAHKLFATAPRFEDLPRDNIYTTTIVAPLDHTTYHHRP